MNQRLPLLGLLLAGLSPCLVRAQSGTAPIPQPAATVHFYQSPVLVLFFPKYRVYANGRLVCKMGRNSHCQVSLPAGSTTFKARFAFFNLIAPPELTLALEVGKNYYLQSDLAAAGAKIPGTTYGFTEVVPNEAKLAQVASARTVAPLLSASR